MSAKTFRCGHPRTRENTVERGGQPRCRACTRKQDEATNERAKLERMAAAMFRPCLLARVWVGVAPVAEEDDLGYEDDPGRLMGLRPGPSIGSIL